MNEIKIYRLDKNQITKEEFKQIVYVEKSGSEDCYTEEQLKEIWLNSDKFDNFVCTIDNVIIAHISLNPYSKRRNGSIFIMNLTVHTNYRRKGIATKLIQEAIKYYFYKKYNLPVSITVDKDNIPALSLYKKIGFEIVEPITEIEEDDTQYIMVSTLEKIIKI